MDQSQISIKYLIEYPHVFSNIKLNILWIFTEIKYPSIAMYIYVMTVDVELALKHD